jgi:6-phosphogluconolactonase
VKPCAANILVCRDPQAVAEEAAEQFICAAQRSVAERGAFFVALSGGYSPRGTYKYLASEAIRDQVPWGKTFVSFTDERCVPPDHEESNYKLVNDLLLSKVPISPSNVCRFPGELPPVEAALQYEQVLRYRMGQDPRFDFILLGMGQDTHTASLFPNSPALNESTRLAVENFVARLNAYRLTLTIPVLRNARQIVILALGKQKASAVRDVLQGPTDEQAHPVQAIRPKNGRLLWIIDQEAASEL